MPGPAPISKRGVAKQAKKSGGRKRANVVLQTESRLQAIADPRTFWSCDNTHPPLLKTSFGNFSTLNLVKRKVITTSTTVDTVVHIPFIPSCVAAYSFVNSGANPGPTQYVYGPLTSAFPLATRPLRMSFELKNTTTSINVAGNVMVLSYDNALDADYLMGAAYINACGVTNATATSFINLIESAQETSTYTGAELLSSHTFSSCPSAWPEYNRYYDFLPPVNAVDSSTMASGDLWNLSVATDTGGTGFVANSTLAMDHAWGDVPGMRGFLVLLKATPNPQTYQFTFKRQDGARYPANTLGHMFHQPAPAGSDKTEKEIVDQSKKLSMTPSAGILTTAVESFLKTPAGRIGQMVYGAEKSAVKAVQNAFGLPTRY